MSVRFEVDLVSDPISLFSMKLSVSVVRALEKLGFSEIKIKWPNDLLIDKKKVCGILQELIYHKEKSFLVIGVGIKAPSPALILFS